MEAFGFGQQKGLGAPVWWGPCASTPTGAPRGHSKPWPAVTDVCHPGRQGRCPWQLFLCVSDAFWIAQVFVLIDSCHPNVPTLPTRGQSLVYFITYLLKTLLNPWPERHLVVMGPTG